METKVTPTIRMPKDTLDKWLTGLRSGEYKQGRTWLQRGEGKNAEFCCLGVLQKVVDGVCEDWNEVSLVSNTSPSMEWLEAHGIYFEWADDNGQGTPAEEFSEDGKPRTAINPALPSLETTAMGANDSHRFSFKKIADAIEACTETY